MIIAVHSCLSLVMTNIKGISPEEKNKYIYIYLVVLYEYRQITSVFAWDNDNLLSCVTFF